MTTTEMYFSKAKREFQIRYYLWAISEWEREIAESFPNMRLFKAGSAWKTHQFMQLLNSSEQLVLARGLLKRFHPDAVKALGESCSREEESLRTGRGEFFRIREQYQYIPQLQKSGEFEVAQYWIEQLRADAAHVPGVAYFDDDRSLLAQLEAVFRRVHPTIEEELAARKQAGEKIKFASKRKLRKVMTAKFIEAFGSRCLGLACVDEEPNLRFKMESCGWIVNTFFDFGRRETCLNYRHNIGSEKLFPIPGGEVAMVMGWLMSFNSHLGISSQTEWTYITDEEIEGTCQAVLKLSTRFFDVLPKLLKGLECEKLIPDEGYELSHLPLR